HAMGPDRGRDPALERRRLARRLLQIPADPAIPFREPGHDARRVQGHLLVGVGAPVSGPAAGDRVCLAVRVVPLARRDTAHPRTAVEPARCADRVAYRDGPDPGRRRVAAPWAAFRARRTARFRRRVDGGERARDPRLGLAISPYDPSRRRGHLAGYDPLDGAGVPAQYFTSPS